MDLSNEIIKYCASLGLDSIGFAQCRVYEELRSFYSERKAKGLENEFEEKDIEKRINPNHYMSEGKTIVSIAFPYLHDKDYTDNGFSLYTRGKDYHSVVYSYLEKIVGFINSLGGNAIAFTDSNTLPERYIAYLAGVGFVGRNNMIITKKYGSYVFLGEIITDLVIPQSTRRTFEDMKDFEECGNCRACYISCPTKSINSYSKNPNICMSYITQKKDIDDSFFPLMNGRVFGCDSCQKGCPFNEHINLSPVEEFYPLSFMEDNNEDNIININNSEFKATFKNSSCGWRGKNILIRNTLIRKALYKHMDISKYKFNSPYLEEYKERIVGFKNRRCKNEEKY
ncbi:tRNA epoxyqueuosine(34) reductase QueG [Clostridium sp. C8-1-8]|uniref:tRNA epoxyqueuosine(34) reductase QueG n=1 Tax=Clostridium sp. C8-1-8 TaxID=2698831 RepID=UPI00136CD657|nr:tRNA epoxyqueuosine(34) reductase QueG [Clostridium sp. C8-1-8]